MNSYVDSIKNAAVHLVWVFVYSGAAAVANYILANWTGGGIVQMLVGTPVVAGLLAYLHVR